MGAKESKRREEAIAAESKPRASSVVVQLLNRIQQQDRALDGYPTKTEARILDNEDQPLFNQEVVGIKAVQALRQDGAVVIDTKRLGVGSFGIVYEAMVNWHKAAVKVIDIDSMLHKHRETFLKDFPRELAIIKRLDHPNIVATICVYLQLGSGRVYIFMEIADSDLAKYVVAKQQGLTEDEVKKLFYQMASGLYYMHSNQWSHRDIKLLNALVFGIPQKSDVIVKLTDFGFARSVLDEADMSETYDVFTASHRPPEVGMKIPYRPLPGDVWSLGVALFTLANRAWPFFDPDVLAGRKNKADTDHNLILEQQLTRKYAWKDPRKWTIPLKGLVAGMLEPVVEDRLTMLQVVTHKWFN